MTDPETGKQKKNKQYIPYGLSELGFLEHLEEVCAQNTVLSSLLYEKGNQVRLSNEGIVDPKDPDFEHTCVGCCVCRKVPPLTDTDHMWCCVAQGFSRKILLWARDISQHVSGSSRNTKRN